MTGNSLMKKTKTRENTHCYYLNETLYTQNHLQEDGWNLGENQPWTLIISKNPNSSNRFSNSEMVIIWLARLGYFYVTAILNLGWDWGWVEVETEIEVKLS